MTAIGHPEALREWHGGDDDVGWRYCDPDNQLLFEMSVIFAPPGLVAIDEFIETLEGQAGAARDAAILRERRARALQLFKESNEGFYLILRSLVETRSHAKFASFVLPWGRMGKKHSDEQRIRREDKPAVSDFDPDRNARIRAFVSRLKAQGSTDFLAQASREFGPCERQIGRIVAKKEKPKR